MNRLRTRKTFLFFVLLTLVDGKSIVMAGKSPYPIIFVHGLHDNATTWDNVFQLLRGAEGLTDGGIFNVTLNKVRNRTSLLKTAQENIDDVFFFKNGYRDGYNYQKGDIYRVNFQVHSDGSTGDGPGDHLVAGVYRQDTSIQVITPTKFKIGDILRVEDEFMVVTSKPGSSLGVDRGLFGSKIPDYHQVAQNEFQVWNLSLESNQAPIVKQGRGLKIVIDTVKQLTGAKKVILFGHSMGGLAIREYLQSNYYQHDVAKVITIGTPHGGSNAWANIPAELGLEDIDDRSGAVRDCKYEFSNSPFNPFDNVPAPFLFSGYEFNSPNNPQFYDYDINCNGSVGDFINGLSESSSIIPGILTSLKPSSQKPLPSDVQYTWITSNFNNGLLDLAGDLIVDLQRQWLYATDIDGNRKPYPFLIADSLLTNMPHTALSNNTIPGETSDYFSIIRGLDEPGDYNLAYSISPDINYSGIITFPMNYVLNQNYHDIDIYQFETSTPSNLNVQFGGIGSGIDSIAIMDSDHKRLTSRSMTENLPININLSIPSKYFLVMYGTATDGNWYTPYHYKIHLAPIDMAIDFSANVTSGIAPLTVHFLTTTQGPSGSTYEWDFKNDGTAMSNAVSPEYTYTSAGTYSVKLTVDDGVETKTILKKDLITVTDDIVTSTKLAAAEYYFDIDPGVGCATNINIPNVSDYQLDARLNVGILPDGIHILGLRVKDAFGIWSFTCTKLFIKEEISSQQDRVITAAEYFVDQDPGIGNGKRLSTSMNSDVSIYSTIDVGSLANGIHTLMVRTQDSNGKWSIIHSQLFLKEAHPNTEIVTIAKAEYYFDHDPGYGMGVSIPITEAANIDNSNNCDLTNIPNGAHNLFVRVKDGYNKWSYVYLKSIIKETYHGAPNLKRIEYFVDHDPGLGNATSAGTNLSDQDSISVTADLSNITPGIHVFFCRAQDADNKWSFIFSKLFLSESGNKSNLITSLEYFFDTDPGWGNGTPITVNAAGDLDIQFNADIHTLSSGPHQLFIRAKDNNGVWSWVNIKDFEKVGISIPLRKNWNLVSWNVDTPVDSTQLLFAQISGQLTSVVSFEGRELSYNPTILAGLNTLKLADHRHGYWLQMNDTSLLNMSGPAVDKQSPIALKAGYNLVSYLPETADSVTSALNSIMGNTIVAMGFDAGGLTFDPNIPPEFNTLKVLSPGSGYWIKLKNADTLIYPETGLMPTVKKASQEVASNQQLNTEVTPSREWMSLWGNNIMLHGQLFPKGTQMTAKTPKGVICGSATAWAEGKFGLMPIYKDDSSTVELEGAAQDEEIVLAIGEYIVPKTIRWTENGLVIDLAKVITGIREMSAVPREYALSQNYPNPFNPSTTIEYGLPVKSAVRLVIYNVLGQVVKELVHAEQTAGWQSVVWNANVASGLYLYRLEAVSIADPSKRFVQTKKLLLLR